MAKRQQRNKKITEKKESQFRTSAGTEIDNQSDWDMHCEERVNFGFSWFDWINFDTYIATVIADALADFRLKGHGYPGNFANAADWHDLLESIEEPLRYYGDKEWGLNYKEGQKALADAQKALKVFAKYLGSMWD